MVLEKHVLRIACYVMVVQTNRAFLLVEATQIPKEPAIITCLQTTINKGASLCLQVKAPLFMCNRKGGLCL